MHLSASVDAPSTDRIVSRERLGLMARAITGRFNDALHHSPTKESGLRAHLIGFRDLDYLGTLPR